MTRLLALSILAACFAATGCSGSQASPPPPPAKSEATSLPRLAQQTRMVACDGDEIGGSQVLVYLPNCPWKSSNDIPYLRVGDRVRVEGDFRADRVSKLKMFHGRTMRSVDVVVETGEWSGKFAIISRANLRGLEVAR